MIVCGPGRPWAVIGVPLLLVLAGCGEGESGSEGDPTAPAAAAPRAELNEDAPNIVVIMIDTLRSDHLPAYGYPRRVAPFLAGLSRRSVVFKNAFSTSSWTGPSTASLFTGLYPVRHGLTRGFFAQKDAESKIETEEAALELTPLPEALATLPILMKDLGYSTYGLAANINIGPELGFQRGFDRFHRDRQESADQMAMELRRWRNEISRSSPTFLYIHFNDVHKPYTPRAPLYKKQEGKLQDDIARYDSEIRWVDRTLKELYDQFGWGENTILWIVSDHGEEFMDHGTLGHGFSLFDELMRVVGILHAPGIEPGSVDVNVSLIDVLPTLMDWLDVPLPDERDGRSLLPLLRGERTGQAEREFGERILFGHRRNRVATEVLWAALFGSWKLIEDTSTGERMLFDLQEDPGETDNKIEEHAELAQVLQASLDRLKQSQSLGSGPVEVPMDEALLEHLRSLGYTEKKEER